MTKYHYNKCVCPPDQYHNIIVYQPDADLLMNQTNISILIDVQIWRLIL